jgi:hypothetical protein
LIFDGEELEKIVGNWRDAIKEAENNRSTLEGWAFDEKSITIPYKLYAWGVLSVAIVVVLGGLAFGFFVGTRIAGVDPFNVTIFFWSFAAFFVLVFKSYKVANWAWRDFLLGRIVCRSVSEVVGVSGIKDQQFLAVLLRMSPALSLEMSGPYHTMFTRKSKSGDGFAIDIRISNDAMAAGGHIFIKVHSFLGPALVAIEFAKWSTYTCVYAKGKKCEEGGIICRDFDDQTKIRAGNKKSRPSLPLCTNALTWYRIVGVYKEDVSFF